jgi:hypothetical protein
MLPCTLNPFAKPRAQCFEPPFSCGRVPFENVPLVVGRTSGFVEQFGGNGKFAYVMEHGTPAQPTAILLRNTHLLGDHVGKGSDSFGMPSGSTIMAIEFVHELKNLFRSLLGVAGEAALAKLRGHSLPVRR